MVIEWLHYRVPPADQPAFLAADAAVWTAMLSACPGFLGKETWRNSAAPDRLALIIRWKSRAEWHSVPADSLAATEARFRAAFTGTAEFLGCTDLDIL
jgi:uncharacterized protein (TIGR03792 family)